MTNLPLLVSLLKSSNRRVIFYFFNRPSRLTLQLQIARMLKEAKNLVRRTEIEHAKSRITGEGLYLFSSDLSILKPEIRRDYTKLFHLLLGILSTHLGSGSRKSGFLRTVPVNTKVFLRGYQNPRRTLGVTTHFPEIIELKFLYFKAF